jgi:hypothetical protein
MVIESMEEDPTSRTLGPADQAPLRRARRWTSALFLAFVVIWVLQATGQITQQVFWPAEEPTPFDTCDEGLRALHAAIDAGRAAAEADPVDPTQALAAYRAQVDPVWRALPPVKSRCQSPEDRRSLDALERLRYAEEHAVRREASNLASLRRQVATDVASRTPSPPSDPLSNQR